MKIVKKRHPLFSFLLVLLFVLDIASDIACGVELFLNDHYGWSFAVFAFVLLPVLVSIGAEVIRGCVYSGCCGEASTDWIPLIFYHVYTIILLIGSGFNYRWAPEANYLRSIEGFLQAGLQLILQIYLIYKGVLIHSLRDTIKFIFEYGWQWNFFVGKPLHWYWGLIQVYSIALSFISVVQTSIQFNEWPKRRHTLHRILLLIPYFASTILYRLLAISILSVFAGKLTLVPVIVLVVAQSITLNSVGLDLARSLVYGFCAFLTPIGYSRCRDPDNQPYGLSLLPEYIQGRQSLINSGGGGGGITTVGWCPDDLSNSVRPPVTHLTPGPHHHMMHQEMLDDSDLNPSSQQQYHDHVVYHGGGGTYNGQRPSLHHHPMFGTPPPMTVAFSTPSGPMGVSSAITSASTFGGGGCISGGGDRNPEQVEYLRHRTKSYLAMHVILGGGVLGIACAIIFLLVNFTTTYDPLAKLIIFDRNQMNTVIFPAMAFSYMSAVLLTGMFTCCIGRCFDDEYVYPV